MKFGKLQDISNIRFHLPEQPATTISILKKSSPATTPVLYVGCTGWSMKEWVGHVYPAGTKTKNFLRHYARQFNTIELNTTHYRIPNEETIEKWYRETRKDFRFCPKIPQSISHSRDMGLKDGKLQHFCSTIVGLKEKLGCCFMQMPPYFGADQLPVLEIFLDKFPAKIPLALEVRHESWFAGTEPMDKLTELLASYCLGTVITDVAGRRDVLHMRLSNTTAMVRFVGNNLHPTDYQRIDQWVQQLAIWYKTGMQKAYFFTHEPDNIKAPELADYLVQQVQKKLPNVHTRGPSFMQPGGQQMTLF